MRSIKLINGLKVPSFNFTLPFKLPFAIRLANASIRVDFPEPLAPITARISSSRASPEISSSRVLFSGDPRWFFPNRENRDDGGRERERRRERDERERKQESMAEILVLVPNYFNKLTI